MKPLVALALLVLSAPLLAKDTPLTYLEIIFDASGSMEKPTERTYSRELKVRIARDEVAAFVKGLESHKNIRLALRVFGTSKDNKCEDSKLLRAFAPISDDLLSVLGEIQPAPFGRTPIAESLVRALDDFKSLESEGSRSIVLITDGVETCDGSVDQAISKVTSGEISLKVHIVGFDVLDWKDPSQVALQNAAKESGGEVLYPKNREELKEDLKTIARKEAPSPTPQSTKSPEPGLLEMLTGNVLLLIGVGVTLLCLGLFLVLRRGGSQD